MSERGDQGASDLDRLADLYGVASAFMGSDGRAQRADQDTVLALLRALGAPIERAADAADAVTARRLSDARRITEPVLVHRIGRRGTITVTMPQGTDPRRVQITVALEGGGSRSARLADLVTGMALREAPDGLRYHRYAADLGELGPEDLPPGYHELVVERPGAPATVPARLISAPACPAAARGWGVFMPLHALRGRDDWGTGNYLDLAALGHWVGRLGGSMVGALPLYPAFLTPPSDPSPYRPVSRLAYNELFIQPDALPELAASAEAGALVNNEAFRARLAAARKSPLVEYEEVAELLRQVLAPMARALFSGASARRDELEAFARAHPELVAYARFRARVDRTGHDRAGRDAGPVEEVVGVDLDDPALAYHLYGQWAAATQLSEAGAALPLYADFPIGVHPAGFDPYWSPESFVQGVGGGAPPDRFFAGGQDWGFPPLHPEGIREDGYRYLGAALARAFRHAGYLRVDHVMGLQRLYMIPDGADARHGAYVSYQADELHALVSLEAARAGAVVIGEDLGTVPPEVHQRMAADKMLRSWVFEFESTAARPLPRPDPEVLASLGTHDLPRFASFLVGRDLDEQEEAGQLGAEAAMAQRAERERWRLSLLHALGVTGRTTEAAAGAAALRGCLAHLATGPADLVLVDLEELWGERAPQNHPGTGTEAGNWRRRGARTLAEAQDDEGITTLLADLDRWRREVVA
ncbi:MAG TPA: 4-alpha-glucanotransferase [Acidimicrobiales bacterium]